MRFSVGLNAKPWTLALSILFLHKTCQKGKGVLGLNLCLLHRNDEKESFSTAAEARIPLGAVFLIFLL